MTPGSFETIEDESDDSDHRHRFFDSKLGLTVVNVFQGDYYVTSRKDEVLTTVLGSCISACIRDPITGYGGMNHFLLPDIAEGSVSESMTASLRYGKYAMEQLIAKVLTRGGHRERLEIKVFGGGNVMASLSDVGHKNADFIEEFLNIQGLSIASQHLRGTLARKLQYFPVTGKVRMRELTEHANETVVKREMSKTVRAVISANSGAIELFD